MTARRSRRHPLAHRGAVVAVAVLTLVATLEGCAALVGLDDRFSLKTDATMSEQGEAGGDAEVDARGNDVSPPTGDAAPPPACVNPSGWTLNCAFGDGGRVVLPNPSSPDGDGELTAAPRFDVGPDGFLYTFAPVGAAGDVQLSVLAADGSLRAMSTLAAVGTFDAIADAAASGGLGDGRFAGGPAPLLFASSVAPADSVALLTAIRDGGSATIRVQPVSDPVISRGNSVRAVALLSADGGTIRAVTNVGTALGTAVCVDTISTGAGSVDASCTDQRGVAALTAIDVQGGQWFALQSLGQADVAEPVSPLVRAQFIADDGDAGDLDICNLADGGADEALFILDDLVPAGGASALGVGVTSAEDAADGFLVESLLPGAGCTRVAQYQMASLATGGSWLAVRIAAGADGTFVVAGIVGNGTTYQLVLAFLDAAGNLETSEGTAGFLAVALDPSPAGPAPTLGAIVRSGAHAYVAVGAGTPTSAQVFDFLDVLP